MVDVIVVCGGCTATSSEIEITIHPSPTITLVSDVGTSACSGSSVEFTATGGNSTSSVLMVLSTSPSTPYHRVYGLYLH